MPSNDAQERRPIHEGFRGLSFRPLRLSPSRGRGAGTYQDSCIKGGPTSVAEKCWAQRDRSSPDAAAFINPRPLPERSAIRRLQRIVDQRRVGRSGRVRVHTGVILKRGQPGRRLKWSKSNQSDSVNPGSFRLAPQVGFEPTTFTPLRERCNRLELAPITGSNVTWCAAHRGSVTVNVLPASGRLVNSTPPLCDSAIHLTIERPSPKPPSWRERALSAR